MRLLLDAHVMLWTMLEPERVSVIARAALADLANRLLVSIASLWEITIKIAAGKLKVPGSDVSFLSDNLAPFGIGVLPILLAHLGALRRLPTLTAILLSHTDRPIPD